MERTEERDGATVVRATFEMLKPVPLLPTGFDVGYHSV